MTDMPLTAPTVPSSGAIDRGSLGTAIVRLALGVTTLFTWFDNVGKDFYDGENPVSYTHLRAHETLR